MDQADKKQQSEFDEIKKFLFMVLANWYWVAASLFIAVGIAFAINRYTTPIYNIYTTILSKKYYRQTSKNAMDVIQGGEYFSTDKDINREITVLKSHAIVSEAIKRLHWEVFYFKEGRIKTSEFYKSSPISVVLDTMSNNMPYEVMFQCTLKPKSFTLHSDDPGWDKAMAGKTFDYGRYNKVNGFVFMVNLNQADYVQSDDPTVSFKVNNLNDLTSEYRDKLTVGWVAKGSAVLNLSVTGPYPAKERDFLTKIGDVIMEKSIIDKNFVATKTIEFIDDQMGRISDSMLVLGNILQRLKLSNPDLTIGSQQLFAKINGMQDQKQKLQVANSYLDYLANYVQMKSKSDIIAPNTAGVESSMLDDLIQQYVAKKMELSSKNTAYIEKSPLYKLQKKESDDALADLESGIMESIETSKAKNNFEIREIDKQMSKLGQSTRSVLDDEGVYAHYQRIFDLAGQFYSMLLTQKLNANIAKASQESDYEVLDSPRLSGGPIVPKIQRNYTFAVILGLGIPMGIIYVIGFFNPFILSREELQKHTEMPMLGMVGHSSYHSPLVVKNRPKSSIAESFRNLRANLQYFLKNGEASRVFLITSSVSSEGKTFCSINLAYTYAISGKKTVVIGADLRKPALSKIFKKSSKEGLSTFLAGITPYEELSQNILHDNLSIIHSGEVPPNPSELIVSEKMAGLMEKLRQDFEIVILDSPPIGLVSDAVELTKFADVNLIIVRQARTRKAALESINQMYLDKKLPNPSVIFNDIDFKKLNYGYKYGYGYGYGYSYGSGSGYGYHEDEPEKNLGITGIFRKSSRKKG